MQGILVPNSWVVVCRLNPTEKMSQVAMKERKKPTKRQQEVLEFIRFFVLHRGLAPSRPEIAEAVGLNHVSNVGWHLQSLEKKGWLTVLPDTPRGIILNQTERLPVIEVDGPVPADEPLVAPQRIVEYMPELIAQCLAPSATYCLRIGQGGMLARGFATGDLVAIQATENPRAGQRIVIRVDGEVMCRALRRKDESTVEVATLGADDKPAGVVHINLAKQAVRFEGIVVRTFGDLDLADIEFPEEPPPK